MPDLKDFELKPCHKGGQGEGNEKVGGFYRVLQSGCSFRVPGQARELGHVVPHRNRGLFRKIYTRYILYTSTFSPTRSQNKERE